MDERERKCCYPGQTNNTGMRESAGTVQVQEVVEYLSIEKRESVHAVVCVLPPLSKTSLHFFSSIESIQWLQTVHALQSGKQSSI